MQLQTTALVQASEAGHAEVVRELARAGANVDHKSSVCGCTYVAKMIVGKNLILCDDIY